MIRSHHLALVVLALLGANAAVRAQVAVPAPEVRPSFQLEGWSLPPSHDAGSCLVELDLDGDGDRDVFAGKLDAPSEIWLCEGGRFRLASGRLPEPIEGVTAAQARDFDGDGWCDLYLARALTGPFTWPGRDPTAGMDRLYLNRADASGRRVLVNGTWGIGREIGEAIANPTLLNLPHFPLMAAFPVLEVRELRFAHDVEAADLDGDGDLDLVLAMGGVDALVRRTSEPEPFVIPEVNAIYWNVGDTNGDGLPNFEDHPAAFLHDDPDTPVIEGDEDVSVAVVAADFDGDGDLDLVFGNLCSGPEVHLGNLASGATNRFYEALFLPGVGRRYVNRSYRVFGPQAPSEETTDLAAADFSGTGRIDLFVLNFQDSSSLGGANHPNRYYRWETAGRRLVEDRGALAAVRFGAQELRSAVTPFDLDGDGDLDALVSGTRPALLENSGGSFLRLPSAALEARHEAFDALAFGADLDGDGRADPGVVPRWVLFSAVREQARLFAPVAGGLVDRTVANLPLDLGDTLDGTAADLDGDGREDLILAQGSRGLRLWMGRAASSFSEEAFRLPAGLGEPVAVAAADLDGVAGPDLLILERGGRHRLLLNDGAGGFTTSAGTLPPDPLGGASLLHARVLIHDVDGDGRRDALLLRAADSGGVPAALPVRLWTNLGGGVMRDDSSRLPGTALAAACAGGLVDVDGDGVLDLLIASDERAGLGASLWMASASGSFRDASANLPSEPLRTLAIASDDLNSDGRPDFYLGVERGGGVASADRVWLAGPDSDGDGIPNYRRDPSAAILAALPGARAGSSTRSVRFLDVDADGDLDLLVGQLWSSSRRYERIAPNTWLQPAPFPASAAATVELLIPVEVDGDGLVDILVAGNTQARLFLNRTR